MENYEEIETELGSIIIRRISDGAFIPMIEGNSDYQYYLDLKNGVLNNNSPLDQSYS
jgi:hypothetical protein